MNAYRLFVTFALLSAGVTALAAREQPPGNDPKGPADAAPDLVARVAKNMQTAEKRLRDTDPGDETRKVQRDIVDDLEEMIKQNTKSQGGGGSKSSKQQKAGQQKNAGAKGGSNDPKQGPKGAAGGAEKDGDPKAGEDQGNHGQAKGGKDEGPQGQEKDRGNAANQKGTDPKDGPEGQAKGGGDPKEGKDGKGQAKGAEPGKEGGEQGGLAGVKHDKATKLNLLADHHRSPWGHLPETKRLEMDAYSKERFMPRYEEVLRQYYRTIAEQGQKKDD